MEYAEFIKQFNRMCWHYQQRRTCPMACPMKGCNISQCRKRAFQEPDVAEKTVAAWVAENPEPVYPVWYTWLSDIGVVPKDLPPDACIAVRNMGLLKPIPAEFAREHGIEPIGGCDERSQD